MSDNAAETPDSATSVLNQIVEKVSDLYTLPAVALRVVQLTGEPKIDCRKLKECIENDPALTCKILKFVNSSVYGLSRTIGDLQEALAILGTNTLKLLVLGFSLPSNLLTGIDKAMLGRYWRMSLTKGVAARELSRNLWKRGGDEAFIGGMLRHVGMLALIQELGKTYTTFLSRVWAEKDDLQCLEVASMGFDHTILSARLLDSWCLPTNLIRAVGVTADPERLAKKDCEDSQLIKTLHMADLVVDLLTNECEESLQELHRVANLYLDGDLNGLDETLDAIEEQVDLLAELLDLELSDATRYAEVLDRARLRLNEMATSAAIDELPETAVDSPSGQETSPRFELPKELTEATIVAGATSDGATSDGATSDGASEFQPDELDDSADTSWQDSSSTSIPDKAAQPVSQQPLQQPETNPLYDPVGEGVRTVCEEPFSGAMDPGLIGRMETSIARSRQHRQCISMAIIEIDGFDDKLVYLSPDQTCQLADTLGMVVRKLFTPEYEVVRVCDSRIAVIMEAADSEHASDLLRQLIQGMKRWSEVRAQKRQETLTISVGLASTGVPPRNFTSDILIERAERCLSAAQHFGGNTIKSIVF